MKKNYSTMINLLKKNKVLTLCALAFMTTTVNLNAQVWKGTADTDYANPANWDTGVVPSATAVIIDPAANNPILGTATTTTCTTLGINVGGILTIKGTFTPSVANYTGGTIIMDGGNLNVRSNFNLGVTNNPSIVTVNSGSLNAKNALIVAEKGNCELNINGGIVSVDQNSNGGAVIIGGYYAYGIVNLNGGVLKTSSSKLGLAALAIQEQPTRSGTGVLKINGGTLVFTNDQSAFVNGYVTAGKIVPGAGKHIVVTVVPAVVADPTATPPIVAAPAITNVTAEANLGIDTKIADNSFSVYPNPSNGVINIDARNSYSGKLNISIYNLLGQEVMKSVLDNNNAGTYRLDATNKLSSGTYIVNIKSESSSHNSKIIVE